MHFKLESNYAVLSPDGTGKWTPGGDAFWSQPPEEIDKVGRDWLVTEHVFTSSWTTRKSTRRPTSSVTYWTVR